MKKRLLSLLLALTLACSLLPFGALAAENEVIYSTRDNDTVLMVSCNGAMPNYTATKPADWSSLKTTVKTVIVEEGVTSIGNFAFNGFTALESVSIPKSATKIGSSAFAGCTALESVTIPADIASIDENAFSGCSKLAKLTLAPTVKSIAQNAFKGTALEKVYFGGTKPAETLTRNGIAKTGNDKLLDLKWDVICDSDKHEFETLNARAATCTEDGYTGDSICKVCGTKNSDPKYGQKVPALSHDWGYWRLATKVTDSQDGVEQRTCTRDKSHVEKVTIPAGTKLAPAKAELLNEATESITVPNSRGNVIWLKWISEGMPAYSADVVNPFSDVSTNDLWYDAVLWAVDQGIIEASRISLCPNEMLTAEQIAAIVGESALPASGYEKDIPNVVTYKTTDRLWEIPAPTEARDANFVYLISSDRQTVGIKTYLGSAGKVIIPEKISYLPIIRICESAFQNKTELTEVTIPATITSIGSYAFDGCTNLRDVYYDGSADQWSDVFIGSNNEPLIGANIHFASTPAKIESDPADVTMLVGQTAYFSVTASGDIASYQWQVKTPSGSWKNSNATGCKTATLEITATAARNGYKYRCIVTGVDGNSVTSEAATLTVAEPVVITGSPMDSVGKAGQIAAFAVWAEGAGLTYQWQYSDNGGQSWKNSSVKAAIYSTKMTAARNGRMVRCVVTDQFGNTATSDTAVMLIKQPLVITSLPKDYVGKAGSTATFSVLAQGRGLTYQWQISDDGFNWANSSVKAASYSTKLTTAKNGRMVRCIVTDANGNSVTSSAARMTIG